MRTSVSASPGEVPRYVGPLLTRELADRLLAGRDGGAALLSDSFDLGLTVVDVAIEVNGWNYRGQRYPWPAGLKRRTIYYWDGATFAPLQRYSGSLIKLIPTDWGAPTFEIDGIKMLPTSKLSPFADAQQKVALVQPRGKQVLDTCGGLGYFASYCLSGGAARVHSFEKNIDVLWLRQQNPWSPDPASPAAAGRLQLQHADVALAITALPDQAFDAALHDPPRFGIAGELYAQSFYDQLSRVLRANARLFHYTGRPNSKTSGRDVPNEVAKRLAKAGFQTEMALDGVLAVKRDQPSLRLPRYPSPGRADQR